MEIEVALARNVRLNENLLDLADLVVLNCHRHELLGNGHTLVEQSDFSLVYRMKVEQLGVVDVENHVAFGNEHITLFAKLTPA